MFGNVALFALLCISIAMGCGGDDQGIPAGSAVDAASIDANSPDGPVVDAAKIDGPEPDAMTDASAADALTIDSPMIDASTDAPVDASVDAALPPAIASISIVGYGNSVQIRQGAGMIRLTVSGSNLSPLSSVSLEDLQVTVAPGGSDTLVLLDVFVSNGVALGYRNLRVVTPGGGDTVASAVAITEITAGPSGNDTSGRGTPDSPFKTASHAVLYTHSGDTLHLLAGNYGPLETWPLFVTSGSTLKGDGAGVTVINGNGAFRFADAPNLTLEAMTIMGFSYCVGGETITLRNLSLEQCTTLGILARDSALIEDCVVRSPAQGIEIQPFDGGDIVLRRVQVVSTAPQTQQSWTGIQVGYGSEFTGAGTIVIEDSVVSDPVSDRSSSYGLYVYPPAGTLYSVRVRRTRIEASHAVRLALNDFQSLDFGTAGSPGANVLVCTPRCIEDIRTTRPAADGPVPSFVGTTFNGVSLPSGTVTGPAFSFPYYYIQNDNNRLAF